MRKLKDWMQRLDALVAQRQAVPFAWGPNDCASWSADAALAQVGTDVLAELRGPRRTERQAWRQIRAGGGIPAALDRAGLQRVPVLQAQRGDLVRLVRGKHMVLAVCMGADALAPGPDGLACAPMSAAVEAWRL